MLQIHSIDRRDLVVAKDRQRQSLSDTSLIELAESIEANGLIHPIVVSRGEGAQLLLVAGGRRLRALEFLWMKGKEIRCGTESFADGFVPCIYLGELDPTDAYSIELDENLKREDLSWQDRARAIERLANLRAMQTGSPPTAAEVAADLYSCPVGSSAESVRTHLLVARHLDDPDVSAAPTARDALKVLKRKEELRRSAELGELVGATLTARSHRLLKGDSLELMVTLTAESYDVILTDPPYGIDAQDFGDSAGKTKGAHPYADDYAAWTQLAAELAINAFRLAKPAAHLYCFCDIDNFHELADHCRSAGWEVFRTPIIWYNPTAMRAPWPTMGPQRKWQMVLYAAKGKRPVTKLYQDLITVPSDVNLNHQAQKPVALYEDLLKRSTRPGDTVLDPFCGTGTIFPAAHNMKCIATGIEVDAAAYGIAVDRLNKL
jgi:site-specific DNA-methyltransferase (adenine-specific)